MTTNTYLITISYDGSFFLGWAKQNGGKVTIQNYIEKRLEKIFLIPCKTLVCSRTDKGVHAIEQKFTFQLNIKFTRKKLLYILKKGLCKYILVKNVKTVSNDFLPYKNVHEKEYRYFINTGKYNIFNRKYSWEYNYPLCTKKINEFLKLFIGEHDFFNFCKWPWKLRKEKKTIRKINSIKSWKRKNILVIKITSSGFLHHQIRAIIGEVIRCYKKEKGKEILENKINNINFSTLKYKETAPSSGLYLWKISYEKNNF